MLKLFLGAILGAVLTAGAARADVYTFNGRIQFSGSAGSTDFDNQTASTPLANTVLTFSFDIDGAPTFGPQGSFGGLPITNVSNVVVTLTPPGTSLATELHAVLAYRSAQGGGMNLAFSLGDFEFLSTGSGFAAAFLPPSSSFLGAGDAIVPGFYPYDGPQAAGWAGWYENGVLQENWVVFGETASYLQITAVTAVPEPPTLVLFAAFLIGTGLILRRTAAARR